MSIGLHNVTRNHLKANSVYCSLTGNGAITSIMGRMTLRSRNLAEALVSRSERGPHQLYQVVVGYPSYKTNGWVLLGGNYGILLC